MHFKTCLFVKMAAGTLSLALVASPGSAGAQQAQTTLEAVPGQSVVGLGQLPGYPELFIHDSAGNGVVQIATDTLPAAYGARDPSLPNYPNALNACLLDDDSGIADVGNAADNYSFQSKKHEYTFTFAEGVSVGQFSVVLLDWGDFLPFGQNADHRSEVTLTAYNAAGNVVDSETLGFTTNSTDNKRVTPEFGDLELAGDACSAQWGHPGKYDFTLSGHGIVRVEFRFRDRASMDPNIGLDRIRYWVTEGVGTQGYWRHHAWPVDSIVLGGVTYTRNQALAVMDHPTSGDMTYAMAQQLIAAMLNVLAGTDASCIAETIAAADAWLAAHPIGSGVKANSGAWKTAGSALHKQLDEYNNGRLCAAPRG